MPAQRVSRVVKRVAVVVLLAVVAVFIYRRTRPAVTSPAPAPAATTAAPVPVPPPAAVAPPIAPRIDRVTKLASPAERLALADAIAASRKARETSGGGAATSARPVPRLAQPGPPALDKAEIRTAMRELIPSITECYEAALPTLPSSNFSMTAALTLTGDPDVGTIVDAHALTDDAGKPLPAALDDCFRSTFQLMALPPLAEGDTIEVNYPFRFLSAEP